MGSSKEEEMSGRISGLESEVRRLRRIVVIPTLAMLLLGGYMLFSRPHQGRPVMVSSLEIRDKEGRLRGSFGLDRDGLPGLRLYDHRGSEQVALAIPSDDTSGLFFSDRGALRVALESSIEGSASLRLLSRERQGRASLALAPDGTTALVLAHGHRETRLGARPDRGPPRAIGALADTDGASTSSAGLATPGPVEETPALPTVPWARPTAPASPPVSSLIIADPDPYPARATQASPLPPGLRVLDRD
jgi:hypothetical protein